MSYQYSQEAKQRISALGQAAVVEFIEEIPHGLRRTIYDRLPSVQGFRPGTLPEFKERQKRLIGHLIHPQTSPKEAFDWSIFTQLWEAWVRGRLGESVPQGDYSEHTPDSGPSFLRELAERFPGAAREDVERLFIFSCFPNHPDVAMALACFRSASTLARDQMIDSLPAYFEEMEQRFAVAGAAAADEAKRIGQLEVVSVSLARGMEDVAKNVSQNSDAVSALRIALDAVFARSETTEKVIDSLSAAGKKSADAATAVDIRTDALEKCVRALEVRGDRWDEVATDAAALKVAVEGLSAGEADRAGTTESVGVLLGRVAALESILVGSGVESGTRQRVRLLENKPEGAFVDILSIQNACDLVASNLQATGIARGAATATARQTVAALVAGQMVQFSGSLADLVADSVAAAIGGPIFHEWRVPVGLISDEAASDCVEIVAESSSCLLLKGANLSAFEVYGAAVRDIVVRRQFTGSSYGSFALIASWAQGPAAFPDGSTLAELGPVFDTDTLPMRGISAKLPQLRYGRLAKEAWPQVDGLETSETTPVTSQLGELLKEADFEGGSLWRRVSSRAYTTLRAMPGGKAEDDLHSLLVSWAAPWARATGGPVKEIIQIAERELAERRADVTV
ncbi:hypothetical protein [Metapseudomonas sp. CR1201]